MIRMMYECTCCTTLNKQRKNKGTADCSMVTSRHAFAYPILYAIARYKYQSGTCTTYMTVTIE